MREADAGSRSIYRNGGTPARVQPDCWPRDRLSFLARRPPVTEVYIKRFARLIRQRPSPSLGDSHLEILLTHSIPSLLPHPVTQVCSARLPSLHHAQAQIQSTTGYRTARYTTLLCGDRIAPRALVAANRCRTDSAQYCCWYVGGTHRLIGCWSSSAGLAHPTSRWRPSPTICGPWQTIKVCKLAAGFCMLSRQGSPEGCQRHEAC